MSAINPERHTIDRSRASTGTDSRAASPPWWKVKVVPKKSDQSLQICQTTQKKVCAARGARIVFRTHYQPIKCSQMLKYQVNAQCNKLLCPAILFGEHQGVDGNVHLHTTLMQ